MIGRLYRNNYAGYLLASLIGLCAALPWLGGHMPKGADTLLHLFRVVQVDHLIQQGILFSRWSPDLAYGYGYPLFNYYAPAAYYLVELIHLVGATLPSAFVLTYIVITVAASLGSYLWIRELAGSSAALLGSAAYVFAPYLLINSLHRGSLPEAMALAIMPVTLFFTFRAVIGRKTVYRVATVISFTALILSHNISALIFSPILILYVVLLNLIEPAKSSLGNKTGTGNTGGLSKFTAILSDLGLIILAIGLSAWYWLPALAEQDLVQLSRGYRLENFKIENNFLTLKDLFAGPFFLDVKLVRQEYPFALNLFILLPAVVSLATLLSPRARAIDRLHILLGALISFSLLLLLFAFSQPFWQYLPLVRFVQFPWRLLGIIGMFMALLATYGLVQIWYWLGGSRILQWLSVLILFTGIVIYALPWTYVDYSPAIEDVTINDSLAFELSSGTIGTTSTGEYLPRAVQEVPPATDRQENKPFEMLPAASLPEGTNILESQFDPLNFKMLVNSSKPFTAVFNVFFFEGWRAAVDGITIPVGPSAPGGLISFEIPAGLHEVEVWFGTTQIRSLAVIVTAAGVLLLAGACFYWWRRSEVNHLRKWQRNRDLYLALPGGSMWAAVLGIVVFLVLRWIALDFYLVRNSALDDQRIVNATHPLKVNFENRLQLIGLSAPSDEANEITLFWQATKPIMSDLSSSLTLQDSEGNIMGQNDNQHIGGFPTSDWEPGRYAVDVHPISMLPGSPPGRYSIHLSIYEYGLPDKRLNVMDDLNNPAGQSWEVGQITVLPQEEFKLPADGRIRKSDYALGQGIVLIGYQVRQQTVWAGEPLQLDLYWEATEDLVEDVSTIIWLIGEDGRIEANKETALVNQYPTSFWDQGDRWLGRHTITVPSSLPKGRYSLAVGHDPAKAFNLLSIDVKTPEHEMERPFVANPQEAVVGDLARLVGYEADRSGQTLSITLFWQSLGETNRRYKSFVHLIDADGRYVSGSDQVPSGWERPTTGWIEGEYIRDYHQLAMPPGLPPGNYALIVGFYDETDQRRLTTSDGYDAITLHDPITLP